MSDIHNDLFSGHQPEALELSEHDLSLQSGQSSIGRSAGRSWTQLSLSNTKDASFQVQQEIKDTAFCYNASHLPALEGASQEDLVGHHLTDGLAASTHQSVEQKIDRTAHTIVQRDAVESIAPMHVMELTGVTRETAQNAHDFIMNHLQEMTPKDDVDVVRVGFGDSMEHLEVIFEKSTGTVFFKSGYDQVLGQGTSKAAVLAYHYFSSKEVVILKPLASLNLKPDSSIADEATADKLDPTLSGTQRTQVDNSEDSGTYVQVDSSTDEEPDFMKHVNEQKEELATLTDEGSVVYHPSSRITENRQQQENSMAWLEAITLTKTLPRQESVQDLKEAFSGPLESLSDEERERYIAKDLSGLPGIMSSLFVDEQSGDIYQERAADDFVNFLEKSVPEDPQRLQAMSGVLDGLVSLHSKGYIHRDLKPANLLLLNANGMISDFGSACQVEGDSHILNYASTAIYGSPEISATANFAMGPSKRVTQKSDIWAMGLILFQMTGKELESHPVFARLTSPTTMGIFRHLSMLRPESPGPLSAKLRENYLQDYPEPTDTKSLEHLIWRCMRLDPAERPSAMELREAYQEILER